MSALASPHKPYSLSPTVAFGSLGSQSTRLMEPVFRASADIIWEMLILDVFALWIPRIFNALDRGSVKTHLNEITSDPKHRSESSAKQIWTWTQKNFRGLNWANGAEETWREIQSVPMILGAQSLFYGIAMADDPVGRGVLLSKNDLDPLTKAYAGYLESLGPKATQSLLRQRDGGFRSLSNGFVRQMLGNHFQEIGDKPIGLKYFQENLATQGLTWQETGRLNRGKALAPSAKQQTLDWLTRHFGTGAELEKVTYNQALDHWTRDWGKAISKNAKYNSYMKPLENVLDELVKHHNERLLPQLPSLGLDTIRLPLASEATKNANQFVEVAEKFSDFTKAVYKRSAAEHAATKQPALGLMTKTLKTMRRQLVTRKAAYSIGVMGVGVLLYFASSLHAQSNNNYPANRLFHKNGDPNILPDDQAIGNRLSRDVAKKGHAEGATTHA